jgi:aryl-alcohol dehydrogenase-like predicted oxidoreductase
MPLSVKATSEGTQEYASRFPALRRAGHFRDIRGLSASSIGIGTYLGNEDDSTDRQYVDALGTALRSGCNVIDTAINYRCQRSERSIGAALLDLIRSGEIRRDEIIVATKGGFIPFDGSQPPDPEEYFRRRFVDTGIAQPGDVVAGCHILTPGYVRSQLAQSLSNLQLECVDIYYIHNPETQLLEVDHAVFLERIRAVFEVLEEEARSGRLQLYATATWDGYRHAPAERGHLSLDRLLEIAREVGGERHRFRVVQLPYNLAMRQAYSGLTQPVGDQVVSLLSAAARQGLYVMASASILQGQLARGLPEELAVKLGMDLTDAQRAIQFVRSTPGLGTALVGMRRSDHVRENLAVAMAPPLSDAEFRSLFHRSE